MDSVRPSPNPLQLVHDKGENVNDHNDHNSDDDIYRGYPPSRPTSVISSASTSSSSSSSSNSFRGAGRLGALAAVLELAITRWAKGNASSDTSSSSSSSVRSSILTTTRSQIARRRKRRSSNASLHTVSSERSIAVRISRLIAIQRSRQIPRNFILYLPPGSHPSRHQPQFSTLAEGEVLAKGPARCVTTTTSLPLVLTQLEGILKRPTKFKRNGRSRAQFAQTNHPAAATPIITRRDAMPFDPLGVHKSKKGKHKPAHTTTADDHSPPADQRSLMPKAWFLDIASPTWEDLRAIGKLLHLHPLTLEDILQQDPREKLELFPKLGYYFISFRVIESQATRDKLRRKTAETQGAGHVHDESPVGESSVYLTVFHGGICCFHYTDISEHTDKVRNRIALLEEVINMSSDWIAHGILDSIVDSFFPFLEEIEKEVVAIDDLVFSDNPKQIPSEELYEGMHSLEIILTEKTEGSPMAIYPEEKVPSSGSDGFADDKRPHFIAPRLTAPLVVRRWKRFISGVWRNWRQRGQDSTGVNNSTHGTLRRMARTRRLVTSLGRLLATKSEVVAQIRKRLLTAGRFGLGNGNSKGEELEVAIYMGDVQDHILTLQHSLAHYERMLSQSHPTYLAQLRSTFATTKGGTDKALIYLTVISMAVLCIQMPIGLFSMNVFIPKNEHAAGKPFNVFGIVIALSLIILTTFLAVVRHWWLQAKRQHGAVF